MKYLVTRVLAILWIATLSIPAAWASKTEDSSDKGWSFSVSPYVWATGLKGTVATLPPLPSVDAKASFGDIIKHVDLGVIGVAELRKGRLGIISDIVWIKISMDSSDPPPSSPFTRTSDLDTQTFMGTLAGAYRLVEKQQSWIDLVLGVRGWHVNTDFGVGPGVLASGSKIDHKEGWVDVIGGLRTRFDLGKGFYATAMTLAGGGSSESVVDVIGNISYAFTNKISAVAGYRYVKVNYQKSGFEWDVEYKGPILGGTYKF